MIWSRHRLTPGLCLLLSQVISDLKSSDFSYSYQTPPASPSNTLSRKSSISRLHTDTQSLMYFLSQLQFLINVNKMDFSPWCVLGSNVEGQLLTLKLCCLFVYVCVCAVIISLDQWDMDRLWTLSVLLWMESSCRWNAQKHFILSCLTLLLFSPFPLTGFD